MAHRDELEELRARVAALENAARRTRRGRAGVLLGAFVALAALVGSAAGGLCASGLHCFTADQPAVAGQVNDNFFSLKDWLERKGGVAGSNTVATDGGVNVVGGNLVVGAGNLDTARLKTSASGVTFHGSGAAVANVDTAGNATFNSLTVNGGNVPRNCTLRRVTQQAQVDCQAGEYVVGGGGDCEANCGLNHSGPTGVANNRGTGWAVDCAVSAWPATCISATPTSVSVICCQF